MQGNGAAVEKMGCRGSAAAGRCVAACRVRGVASVDFRGLVAVRGLSGKYAAAPCVRVYRGDEDSTNADPAAGVSGVSGGLLCGVRDGELCAGDVGAGGGGFVDLLSAGGIGGEADGTAGGAGCARGGDALSVYGELLCGAADGDFDGFLRGAGVLFAGAMVGWGAGWAGLECVDGGDCVCAGLWSSAAAG